MIAIIFIKIRKKNLALSFKIDIEYQKMYSKPNFKILQVEFLIEIQIVNELCERRA